MSWLYAIASTVAEFERYCALDIPIVQYREKGVILPPEYQLPPTNSKIVMNDSLESAERHGVWAVHLGQQDLARYPRERILQRNVALGISTHSDEEIAHALTYRPDYIAFGPIFPTNVKVMPYAPQGVERLAAVVRQAPCPVVAIGGITPENYAPVCATDVWAIAVLSALPTLSDTEIRSWSFLEPPSSESEPLRS